ncbi:DUF4112 domain-containing protein [Henriciella algicola]|uniref:DUF4112 domain-containing protein n=1 Tax=Henriciella algicola TaxID=1608422 RepID=A0A399RM99_9PROT|nr:DUF4112 domain-containing protein [Henriciella algicola]RIJ30979.1 DUF4112 domain-containing protein [Henriciella algicola]
MPTGNRSDIDRLAKLLDTQFKLPGTNFRFGLDGIIGLIPGIGDTVSGGLGLYIIHRARQEGASGGLIAKMIWNLLVDTVLGAIPLVGDLFDFAHKANAKNARLLQEYLDRHASEHAKPVGRSTA